MFLKEIYMPKDVEEVITELGAIYAYTYNKVSSIGEGKKDFRKYKNGKVMKKLIELLCQTGYFLLKTPQSLIKLQ